jgi:hypothetical protein
VSAEDAPEGHAEASEPPEPALGPPQERGDRVTAGVRA